MTRPYPEAVWYTACPAPTPLSLAWQLGWIETPFARHGIAVRSIRDAADPRVRGSHFDHTLPRVLTRDPIQADALFGGHAETVVGDFADPASLDAALLGIERVFLLAPISESLGRHQIAVVEAAWRAGVARVVKVSGSHWAIDSAGQSISGDLHAEVEDRLATSGIESVSVRPNGWMQVSLPPILRQLVENQPLAAPWGSAGIGMIDARDIADVAVHQLLASATSPGPLVLTGPEVVTLRSIAADVGGLLGRSIPTLVARTGPPPSGDSFHERAVAEFMVLIGAGHAAQVTPAVERLLGRRPRTAEAWFAEQLAEVPA